MGNQVTTDTGTIVWSRQDHGDKSPPTMYGSMENDRYSFVIFYFEDGWILGIFIGNGLFCEVPCQSLEHGQQNALSLLAQYLAAESQRILELDKKKPMAKMKSPWG